MILGTLNHFTFDINANAQIIQGQGHFQSLKEVLQDREKGDPLTCPNPIHVLVLRPNSNWACVYFETAKHLNWDTVLYTVPDAPQITTSILYNNNFHSITYQTNEGAVDSVESVSDGYGLEISLTPTQKGDLMVIFASVESDLFENYCTQHNAIEDSEYFIYLIDGVEVAPEEIDTNSVSTTVKLHYGLDAELIEIILICLI